MKNMIYALVIVMVFFTACETDPREIWIYSILDAKIKLANPNAGGDSPNRPVLLLIRMDIGDLSKTGNNYLRLLEVIGDSGLYAKIFLDSSKIVNTTVFTAPPLNKAVKGMDKILGISLPQSTKSVIADKNGNSPFFFYENLLNVDGGNYSITKIGDNAFSLCKDLMINGLHNVKTVGKEAFRGCENIEYMYFYHLETIGDNAFFDCSSLQKLTMEMNKPPKLGCGVFLGSTPASFTISVKAENEDIYRAWLLENALNFNNNGKDIVIEIIK